MPTNHSSKSARDNSSPNYARQLPVAIATSWLMALSLPASAYGIEEVMVTARKKTESAMDVPISISVFNQADLESPLIDDLSQLDALASNVDFINTAPLSGSSNAASVFIRGVGQNDFLLTTDPGVGIYLDGVYIARSIGGVLQLADTERVEILRGPQGTLFGKNTIGGAIQVVTKKPGDETHAKIATTLGDDNRRDLQASIEGSLAETIQARISLLSEKRDGYVKRLLDGIDLGDVNRTSLSARMIWQMSDASEWDFAFDHTRQRQQSVAQSVIDIVPTQLNGLYNLLVGTAQNTAWDQRWVTGNPFTTFQTGRSQDDADISGASLTYNFTGEQLDFTAITGYRRLDADYARDPDGSPLQAASLLNHDTHDQFSQELRVSGLAFDGRLDWQAGLYYFREHGINQTEGFLFSGLYQAAGNNPLLDLDFIVNNDIKTQSYAFFTQATGELSDKLNLTIGLRSSKEKKTFTANNFTLNANIQIAGPNTEQAEWTNTSPMATLDYHASDNTLIYASASKGFKSGGFNGRQIFPGPLNRFDPEFATSVELGVKTRFEALNTSLEAAVFNVNYDDLQFTTLVGTMAGLLPVIDNAAKATIEGLEVTLIRKVPEGLSFNTGVGYLNAGYDKVAPNAVITGKEDLVRTPEWSAHLQLSYRWQAADWGSIELTGSSHYSSRVYHDANNTRSISQGDLVVVNSSLGWRSVNENWSADLFVTNLTDETYLMSGSAELVTVGGSEGHYARPRAWGVKVGYQF